MKNQITEKQVIPLVKTAVNTLLRNKILLFPYSMIVFVQLFILEILYFIPRFPLNKFFSPIITTFWSEKYLHYPLNLLLLPQLFQKAQPPVYILISSFFVAASIYVISEINNKEDINILDAFKRVLTQYIHIVIATLISFLLIIFFFEGYGLIVKRAMIIRSTQGVFYWIKVLVIGGTPYVSLLISIFVTTIFAYVYPAIVLDKKKIFSAIGINFKMLSKSFWNTFFLVLIPTLFFVPILLLRNSFPIDLSIPEIRLWLLILSIFIMIMIDAVVYTAVTIFYLTKKEVV